MTTPGKPFFKIWAIAKGFFKRVAVLFFCAQYDFIFIHREATPVGPPVFEFIIAKVLRKKIIYDFDDAIWLTDRPSESPVFKLIKWRSKVAAICKWSHKVSAGNDFLASFAMNHASVVVVNPTTIDLSYHQTDRLTSENNRVVIGWTGSHSTLKYLKQIETVLQQIALQFDNVDFIVIADRQPELELSRLGFIKWDLETEIRDLSMIDIGIMPLPDDEWSKGKCGFKLLQYMSMGIPAVASPVGVNTQIIEDGVCGFTCTSENEWKEKLSILITNKKLRTSMGARGRQVVEERYSVTSNAGNFVRLFE